MNFLINTFTSCRRPQPVEENEQLSYSTKKASQSINTESLRAMGRDIIAVADMLDDGTSKSTFGVATTSDKVAKILQEKPKFVKMSALPESSSDQEKIPTFTIDSSKNKYSVCITLVTKATIANKPKQAVEQQQIKSPAVEEKSDKAEMTDHVLDKPVSTEPQERPVPAYELELVTTRCPLNPHAEEKEVVDSGAETEEHDNFTSDHNPDSSDDEELVIGDIDFSDLQIKPTEVPVKDKDTVTEEVEQTDDNEENELEEQEEEPSYMTLRSGRKVYYIPRKRTPYFKRGDKLPLNAK